MSKRLPALLLLSALACYALVIGPFTTYMRNKPMEEKLGYIPSLKILKPLSADQREVMGASLVFKLLMYYGGILGKGPEGLLVAEGTDLKGMSRLLHASVQLDPYNMDAYYFAQGILTWDAGQYQVANELLKYGMKYRDWDWYLPYFAAFNYAYFLKEYDQAAHYYDLAGELSGEPLFKSLASRYLQEAGETELAIVYLTGMVKGAKNQGIRKGYELRLRAFQEVRRIEVARERYLAEVGSAPASVEQLVQSGFLNPSPVDPYGGRFFLEPDGKVASTSKFALKEKQQPSRRPSGPK